LIDRNRKAIRWTVRTARRKAQSFMELRSGFVGWKVMSKGETRYPNSAFVPLQEVLCSVLKVRNKIRSLNVFRHFNFTSGTAISSLLCNGYRVFPGVKWPGLGVDHRAYLVPRLQKE